MTIWEFFAAIVLFLVSGICVDAATDSPFAGMAVFFAGIGMTILAVAGKNKEIT